MKKYEDALDYFKNRDEGDNITVTCDWLDYIETLQELVDKETPMKPKQINEEIGSLNYKKDKVK